MHQILFLGAVEDVQNRFLVEIGLSASDALLSFSLAPLQSRRDIAMLGILHRVLLGVAPTDIASFFPPMRHMRFPRDARGSSLRYNKQLLDRIDGSQPAMLARSLFGQVYIYNLLPQRAVDVASVKKFQSCLQGALKVALRNGVDSWPALFRSGPRCMSVEQFQGLF